MNRIRMWPHGALIILGCAVIGAIGALLWAKYERKAEASSLPNAARIERVEGQVGVNQSADSSNNGQWVSATPNMSVTVGDRIYTKQNARTQIGFTGRNVATATATDAEIAAKASATASRPEAAAGAASAESCAVCATRSAAGATEGTGPATVAGSASATGTAEGAAESAATGTVEAARKEETGR